MERQFTNSWEITFEGLEGSNWHESDGGKDMLSYTCRRAGFYPAAINSEQEQIQVYYGPGLIGGLKTRPTSAQVLDGKPKYSTREAGFYPAAHNSEMK